MVDARMKNYVAQIATASDQRQKLEMAVSGFVKLFPFKRASLFAYSPLSYIGEGLIRIDQNGIGSMADIREDVREIPTVFTAIQKRKTEYVTHVDRQNLFPTKYVNEFQLSSLVVIPICRAATTVGCAFVDRYQESGTIQDELLQSLSAYGRLLADAIGTPLDKPKQVLLSKRETEVLQRMAEGDSIKEMAYRMRISEYTVREYIQSAMRKMGAQHRAQAVAEAIRQGIID